ncbi:hypothetical protein AB1Y20_001662 [Prymnesium parvum]|uniref:Uncharacterized protein n=1 Tax=Prymnesium parvum TaxID=97485 RepID=A0AB34KA39_PRYPA
MVADDAAATTVVHTTQQQLVVPLRTARAQAKPSSRPPHVRSMQYAIAAALALVTFLSAWLVRTDMYGGRSAAHVWWYGWVTALSTGLGALPAAACKGASDWWMGLANALAAGMMCAASCALLREGFDLEPDDRSTITPRQGVFVGLAAGAAFVGLSQKLLEQYGDLHLGVMEGVDARKALLIVAVMAVHSFSEGIAIGVSFRGSSPPQLGMLVTTSLAVHNVPEGFAVSVPLISKGMSTLGSALLSVGTSVPQPLMAVLAFYFVDMFVLIQPIGLGFAAGAMFWVVFVELFPESHEACGLVNTAAMGATSAAIMMFSHEYIM